MFPNDVLCTTFYPIRSGGLDFNEKRFTAVLDWTGLDINIKIKLSFYGFKYPASSGSIYSGVSSQTFRSVEG